ncbi:MAG TPA: C4-type zinc ribbon domain-containing protein [Gemmataceae bacterium]|jgi:predicted  nucleic acid-binding Zn-ribbon protein|nr:C4-type zinc ribbon domain-containing protein [Gemmataceae bacterium]
MAGPATILREIHRLRKNARDLQNEIERLPRLLKAQQGRITKQEEGVREAQEVLKKAKLASHEKESELKSMQQLMAKHEKQLSEATSKKEYDALKVEIADDKKKSQQIEDKILEAMVAVEEKSGQIPLAEKAVAQAKMEYADYDKSSQARLADLKEQLAKVQEAIKDVETTLPSDILPVYQRQVGARGEDAMAAVQNRTCMACYTEITAQAYNDLMLSQFIICKSCGRVLYLPE